MTNVEQIHALTELERFQVEIFPQGDNEIRIICPFHSDNSPSLCLNIEKNLFNCPACKTKGDIVKLLARIGQSDRKTILLDLAQRYDLKEAKIISQSIVEKHHQALLQNPTLRKPLYDRGVTDEMIRWARLGSHAARIQIPIFDRQENCVNIRRYLPGAPSKDKMKNTPGHGQVRLYGIRDLDKYNKIWICGGEIKRLVTAWLLRDEGYGAVSPTAGEGSWESEWTPLFKGKTVYVCMDVDKVGRNSARAIAAKLRQVTPDVFIIHLPLDTTKFPKGDINDYVGQLNAGTDELLELVKTAEAYVFDTALPVEDLKASSVSFKDIFNPEGNNQAIAFSGQSVMEDEHHYDIPRNVIVNCDRSAGPCHLCPVSALPEDDKGVEMVVPKASRHIFSMIEAGDSGMKNPVREALGVPKCKTFTFQTVQSVKAAHVILEPELKLHGDQEHQVGSMPALVIGNDVNIHTPYAFKGVTYANPKTQRHSLLIFDAVQTEDSLDTFELEDPRRLDVFRVESEQSIEQKFIDIYDDLSTNITRIYDRFNLHLAIDLVYHSPLFFDFDTRRINGWLDGLIIGDSGQGKTEASTRMQAHYGIGARVECKNSSRAGLLGGLQQIANKWYVSWGEIPRHDRQLLMLEEVKGLAVEDIGTMTDMRSSGVAEIAKIEHRRVPARTRKLWISNPRGARKIASFAYGVQSVSDLIGSHEDVRRFDFALGISNQQVSVDSINRRSTDSKKVDHTYKKNLCKDLILWIWSLRSEQVIFSDDATDATLELSAQMVTKYDDSIPLVDGGTMKFKLARVAAAIAGRVYSEENGNLLVQKMHVDFAYQMLNVFYDDILFGYADFSKMMQAKKQLVSRGDVRKWLLNRQYPSTFVAAMLEADKITLDDITAWEDCEREQGSKLLSFLVRQRALLRDKREYIKNDAFITLLKELQLTQIPDKEQNQAF